jgi:hypothetical protein
MALLPLTEAYAAKPAGQCPLRVIRDWDEASSNSRHVGYVPESGSEIRVLASTTMAFVVDGVARRVIQSR